MEDSTIAIFVMLNNLMHDFAVSVLFATLIVQWYVLRRVLADSEPHLSFVPGLVRALNRVALGCWVVIILGGVVRTITYEDFEWSEAAGRGQVAALAIKHVVLVTFVVWGTIIQLRLRRIFRGKTS